VGITKWAAIAVTSLMGLANIGLLASSHLGLKILGPVLAVAAVISVIGLLTKRPWGTRSVIAVGVANLIAAVAGALAGVSGWPVGMVLAGLAIVLAAVSSPGSRRTVMS
jgi:hypothetical protein